jgi:NAD dependent epimerase/dehydratase
MARLKGKRVLVTGADGFIGSHLTEALVREGADVRALVVYNSLGSNGWLDRSDKAIKSAIDLRPGDVRDPFFVHEVTRGIDIVFHLAALIAIPYSYVAPQAYVETNVTGTTNIVEAARRLDVSHCIVTSTSEVYGTARFVPITEEHPLQGQSPYSASKIGADMIALSYQKSFGTPVSLVRPFNTYGPRQSARAVLPTIITQIAAGKRTIRLGDVRPTRDFNYVKDTVSGFIAVANATATIGHVTNIASNFEISVGDAVKVIARKMGVNITIETDQNRIRPEASEVERLWGDNTKARERCGWTPSYGGLDGFERGIGETIEWFSDRTNLAAYNPDVYQV